ncbi:MAG: hypothetical protein JNL02_05070 [Saprospiraceae bacterium]|nr:hypothetical protein [Saprospiraceae bacterium]
MKYFLLCLPFALLLVSVSAQQPAPSGQSVNIAIFGIETVNIKNGGIGQRVERAVEAAFSSCDRYNVRYNLPYRDNKTMTPGTISAKEVEIQQMIIDLYINRKQVDNREIKQFARSKQIQNIVIGRLEYHANNADSQAYELNVYYIDLDRQMIIGEPFFQLIGKQDITDYNFIKDHFIAHLRKEHLCVADYSDQINSVAAAKQHEAFLQDLQLLIKLEYISPGDPDIVRELRAIKSSGRNGLLIYLKYKFFFYQKKVTESLDQLNDCIERELKKDPDNPNAWQIPCRTERARAIRLLDATLDILYEIKPLLRNPQTIEVIDDFIEGYSRTKSDILKA